MYIEPERSVDYLFHKHHGMERWRKWTHKYVSFLFFSIFIIFTSFIINSDLPDPVEVPYCRKSRFCFCLIYKIHEN